MTDLSRLKVSLTKHGAHKIALLLNRIEVSEILNSLWGRFPDIHIDAAQAQHNLSSKNGQLPSVWNEAKLAGPDTINALSLIAIIFSHNQLIAAMKEGATSEFTGTIIRGKTLDGKAYTNFAHTLVELGYATDHSANHVTYDLAKLFQTSNLNRLALQILELKLRRANWNAENSLIDELLANDFEKVFAVSKQQLNDWLTSGVLAAASSTEDLEFFFASDNENTSADIQFKAGHNTKKTGKVTVNPSEKRITANLLHNEIQNSLYTKLCDQYGKDAVGTEIGTGLGTAIDIMVKTPDECFLYEIKTADTVKTCIRQAIPQLLEYAYWKDCSYNIDKLIIVSPLRITNEANAYLAKLREKFNLPFHYEQFELTKKA